MFQTTNQLRFESKAHGIFCCPNFMDVVMKNWCQHKLLEPPNLKLTLVTLSECSEQTIMENDTLW
jgi:hypothetical protein